MRNRATCSHVKCKSMAMARGKCFRHAYRTCSTKGCTNVICNKTGKCRGCVNGTCSIEGCTKVARVKRGKCRKHALGKCSIEKCEKVVFVHGKCRRHMYGTCSVIGCNNIGWVAGNCWKHTYGTCSIEGCGNVAQNRGKCAKHKGKYCRKAGCLKQPHLNALCCTHCKRCSHPGCERAALRGSETFQRCKKHGGGYLCVICKEYRVNWKDTVCWVCKVPDHARQQRLKRKKERVEEKIRNVLHALHIYDSYHDQPIRSKCHDNKRRGDLAYIVNTNNYESKLAHFKDVQKNLHAVILEIDENQHRYYNITCECARISELKEQVMVPLHVIRYNPDTIDDTVHLKELCDTLKDAAVHNYAFDEPSGVKITYIGYTEARVEVLRNERKRLHSQINQFSLPHHQQKRALFLK